jgi:thiol-disulfide isomerase/thioredoxin
VKPAAKGFFFGLVAGVAGTVFLEVCVTVLALSAVGQSWIGSRFLPTPRFPTDEVRLGQVDYDWDLHTLDGRPVSFAEFRGKPVFLNLWASWCAPCRMEMPGIERLSRSLEGSGIAFVIASEEDADVIRSYAERNSLGITLYVVDRVPAPFEVETIPRTYIIDPGGTIVFERRGAAAWDVDACRDFLRRFVRAGA